MSSSAPIGVFDSGLGGISVARQIAKDMPAEHVLYFGDSANAPYGIKTPEQVRARVSILSNGSCVKASRPWSSHATPPLPPR